MTTWARAGGLVQGGRRVTRSGTVLAWAFVCSAVISAPALAQGVPPQETVTSNPVDAARVIPLYDGVAPGSESWKWHEQTTISYWGLRWGRLTRNIVSPSLVVFKPQNPARDTHTAVVVMPGGAFRWLAIDCEGYAPARLLAAQGVTAIVLKYRLLHMTDDDAKFPQEAMAAMQSAGKNVADAKASGAGSGPVIDMDPKTNFALTDGMNAMRYVRAHAQELGVDAHRVGALGFSAGGFIVSGLVNSADAAVRPDFAGLMYAGGAAGTHWSADVPPMFLAVAANDFLRANVVDSYTELVKLGKSPELHVFQAGGHGFGATPQGFTSDQWFDEFAGWMQAIGMSGAH